MWSKSSFASKFFLGLLVIVLIFLGKYKFQQYRSQRAIEKEKQNLLSQAQELEKKNQELTDTLSYLDTPDFKERVARQQLNLKRDGEIVYNFSQGVTSTPASSTNGQISSNAQKWWHYFFK